MVENFFNGCCILHPVRNDPRIILLLVRFDPIFLDKLAAANYTEISRMKNGLNVPERNEMNLSELGIGESAVITKVGGENALRLHLLDMGLIPHTQVTLIKVAPMGDPLEFRIRGYDLTLRKEDAANITVAIGGCTGNCGSCKGGCGL